MAPKIFTAEEEKLIKRLSDGMSSEKKEILKEFLELLATSRANSVRFLQEQAAEILGQAKEESRARLERAEGDSQQIRSAILLDAKQAAVEITMHAQDLLRATEQQCKQMVVSAEHKLDEAQQEIADDEQSFHESCEQIRRQLTMWQGELEKRSDELDQRAMELDRRQQKIEQLEQEVSHRIEAIDERIKELEQREQALALRSSTTKGYVEFPFWGNAPPTVSGTGSGCATELQPMQ
jgi:uncharacterized protein (DUF3084 family)